MNQRYQKKLDLDFAPVIKSVMFHIGWMPRFNLSLLFQKLFKCTIACGKKSYQKKSMLTKVFNNRTSIYYFMRMLS